MEVHHHPHVERKNFKEYLLEGLMIFLAVTMGFFAESLREVITDREREKQNMETLVMSIASDTLELQKVIRITEIQSKGIDSFLLLKRMDIGKEEYKNQFYYYVFKYLLGNRLFKTNDAALEQMKSSGGFRLIHKQNVIDNIFKYELLNKKILLQEADNVLFYKQLAQNLVKIIDLSAVGNVSFVKTGQNNTIQVVPDQPLEELSTDKLLIKETYNNASALGIADAYYINALSKQLVFAKSILAFLKKQYHLEKE